jgi:hypothetical protein
VLFTADALHCQKDSFTRAAETDNGLLVQVKRNQPTLHETRAPETVGQFRLRQRGVEADHRWRAWPDTRW